MLVLTVVGLVLPGVPSLLFAGPGVVLVVAGLVVRVVGRRADPVSPNR